MNLANTSDEWSAAVARLADEVRTQRSSSAPVRLRKPLANKRRASRWLQGIMSAALNAAIVLSAPIANLVIDTGTTPEHSDSEIVVSRRVEMAFANLDQVHQASSPVQVRAAAVSSETLADVACASMAWPNLGCSDPIRINAPVKVATVSLHEGQERERARNILERLNGNWRSGEHIIRIDTQRSLANIDPRLPFEWKRFSLRDVTDELAVFAIGYELFEARLADGALVLTGSSFRGERTLHPETSPKGRVKVPA